MMDTGSREWYLSTTAVVIFVYAQACGGMDDSTDIEQFTGTWEYQGGTFELTCGDSTATNELTGTIEIREGTDTALVLEDDDCSWDFEKNGDTAEIISGQECTSTNEQGNTFVFAPSSWTFEVSGDSATEEASTEVTQNPDGENKMCQASWNSQLEKVEN